MTTIFRSFADPGVPRPKILEGESAMDKEEPPSTQSSGLSSLFRIGKDRQGHWVVQDQEGLRGGLFVGRAEALKFAMFENGNRPQAVIMVPGVLELDLGRGPRQAMHVAANTQVPLRRLA
jgi:hypothetical protein